MKELSGTFKLVTVWLVIGAALFLGVKAFEAQRQRSRFAAEGGVIELRRAPDGHFHWPGRVGDIAVDFLVDTGATSTALPERLADRAGLPRGHPIRSSTAGGTAFGYASRADITLDGGVRATNLNVAVLPGLERPLLGMDVLSRMHFTQRDGVLTLAPDR